MTAATQDEPRVLPETLPCPECGAPARTLHAGTCRTYRETAVWLADLATRYAAERRAPRPYVAPCWACDTEAGRRHVPWCPDAKRDKGRVYRGYDPGSGR